MIEEYDNEKRAPIINIPENVICSCSSKEKRKNCLTIFCKIGS